MAARMPLLNNHELKYHITGVPLEVLQGIKVFIGANFEGSNLSLAGFEHLNLSNANFTGANLKDAQIKDADFTGAQIKGRNLGGWK